MKTVSKDFKEEVKMMIEDNKIILKALQDFELERISAQDLNKIDQRTNRKNE